jgi:isopenicillin N synthase-like dioxygenase
MDTTAIPVINAATLQKGDTMRALDCACRTWGSFQLVGHGIDEVVAGQLLGVMHSFFTRSRAEKLLVRRCQKNPWGFYDEELTGNVRDWKEIYDFGPAEGADMRPQWPQGLPEFRAAVSTFYEVCEQLAFKVLAAISDNLGASHGQTSRYFRPSHTSFLRLNYYPPYPRPDSIPLGVNPHTDAGALTLLLQDQQAGLEVQRDGHWHLVETVPGALVVNLGDIVQVWSNDRYVAPLHRARSEDPSKPRYSAPFFFNPAYATDYQPLPATIDKRRPARYRSINWGEFRGQRALGDYADYGEEVQISHYRVGVE